MPLYTRNLYHRCQFSNVVEMFVFLPSLISFCLLRNQSGILYWRGFDMIVIIFSTSSSLNSPARLSKSISAYKQKFTVLNYHKIKKLVQKMCKNRNGHNSILIISKKNAPITFAFNFPEIYADHNIIQIWPGKNSGWNFCREQYYWL